MEVCRLCLDLVATQGDAKPLDGETRDMVQVVAPELNLEASKNPSVCSECQKTLSRLFDFKSRVFEHEGEIREKVGDRRGTVSLKAAVTGEADPPLDPDRDKAKDRLCRTCLAPIECESFTVLRPSEPDAYLSSMLDMCLVEVDLALTKDPVMCEGCLDNLQKLHHFKSSCQDVEDKIVDYCNKNKLKESTVVDLHAVLESERPRDIEMLTVKDEDGASGSKIKDEEKEVEPKSEDEDEEMSEDEEEDEEMSEDEEVKQEELDIKSETEPGTSDSDKVYAFLNRKSTKGAYTKWFVENDVKLKSKCVVRIHKANWTNQSACSPSQFKSPYNLRSSKEATTKLQAKSLKVAKFREEGYFLCSKCSFKSVRKWDVKNHESIVHEGKPGFQCDLCLGLFRCFSRFKLHKKKQHGLDHTELSEMEKNVIDEKSFRCKKCEYKTLETSDLIRHNKKVHGDVFRYKCHLCSAQFISVTKRIVHLQDKHGIELKHFQCTKCEYKTIRKKDVIRHYKVVHEGICHYECHLCPAGFRSTRKRKLHIQDEHGMESKHSDLQTTFHREEHELDQ